MPSYDFTSLTIQGFGGKPVSNIFMRQSKGASTLAVIYPGLNYTCDMPLLYYPANLLLQHGVDVLEVKADYTQPALQALPGDERLRWTYEDASAALQAGRSVRQYDNVVLIGKSIGTLTLATMISMGQVENALLIWLTPLLRQPLLVDSASGYKGPALYIVGTADSTYEAGALERIRAATKAEVILVEGGNHRLEVEGELYLSLHRMEEILYGIEEFLQNHGI